jgi:hypothetical protein
MTTMSDSPRCFQFPVSPYRGWKRGNSETVRFRKHLWKHLETPETDALGDAELPFVARPQPSRSGPRPARSFPYSLFSSGPSPARRISPCSPSVGGGAFSRAAWPARRCEGSAPHSELPGYAGGRSFFFFFESNGLHSGRERRPCPGGGKVAIHQPVSPGRGAGLWHLGQVTRGAGRSVSVLSLSWAGSA